METERLEQLLGGDANEIDYLSPGQGISSSLSPSQKQVGFGNGTANDAIGSFTATTLNLLGGEFTIGNERL